MVPHQPSQLPRIGPPEPMNPPVRPGKGDAKGGEFARILADLEELEQKATTSPGAGLSPADLARELDRAEESFRKAMEIRHHLEEAWQQARHPYGRSG